MRNKTHPRPRARREVKRLYGAQVQLAVYLPPDVVTQIEKIATEDGRTISNTVRYLINRGLKSSAA